MVFPLIEEAKKPCLVMVTRSAKPTQKANRKMTMVLRLEGTVSGSAGGVATTTDRTAGGLERVKPKEFGMFIFVCVYTKKT